MPPLTHARGYVGPRAAGENKPARTGVQPPRRSLIDDFSEPAAIEMAYVFELAALGALDLNRTKFASKCRIIAQKIRERRKLSPDAGRLPDDAGGML